MYFISKLIPLLKEKGKYLKTRQKNKIQNQDTPMPYYIALISMEV